MNIKEVLKEENVGKEYKIGERIYEVVKSFSGLLLLKNVKSYGYIEYEMYIFDIINGEFEEYLDWSKVPIDTKILVSEDGEYWIRRYFAKYEGGHIYAFSDGATSFTACDESECDYQGVCSWDYAKLYEE